MKAADIEILFESIMAIAESEAVMKVRQRLERHLANLAETMGLPTPELNRRHNPDGSIHLAALMPVLYVDAPLEHPATCGPMKAAIETAAIVDLVGSYNISLQSFFPERQQDMMEDHKLMIVVAVDQWDTEMYVADQARLAAALALYAADRSVWLKDTQTALVNRQNLIMTKDALSSCPQRVVERTAATEAFNDLLSMCGAIHEVELPNAIGPAIKDEIEYLKPEDCASEAGAHASIN